MATNSLIDSFVASLPKPDKPFELFDGICRGLALRVEKSGRKFYYVYLYTPDGAPVRKRYRWKIGDSSTFKLYKNTPSKKADRDRSIRDIANELKAKARKVDLRVERRAAVAKADSDKTGTLGSFIDLVYTDFYRSEGRARPESQMKWVKSAFVDLMDLRLEAITHLTLRSWQKEASKTRAPATVARLLQSLSGVLSHAVSNGLIPHHPLQAAQRNKTTTKFNMPKFSNQRVRFLDEDEEKRLREALIDRDKRMIAGRISNIKHKQERGYKAPPAISGVYFDHLSPLVGLAMNSGIRLGALLGLEWADVKNGQIHIRPELDKSREGYYVPLNAEASEIVRLWHHQTGGRGLLFKHPVTGKGIKSVKTAWLKVIKTAQLEDFKFHDLRHHFASMLVKEGEDLYMVSQLLGHSDMTMSMRYAHISADAKKAAVGKLDK